MHIPLALFVSKFLLLRTREQTVSRLTVSGESPSELTNLERPKCENPVILIFVTHSIYNNKARPELCHYHNLPVIVQETQHAGRHSVFTTKVVVFV